MISRIRLQLLYKAIKEMSTSDTFSIVLLCENAQVSRTVSLREEENSNLMEDILLLYDQVNVTKAIDGFTMMVDRRRRRHGMPAYNEKRVYRLIRIHKIRSVIRQERKRYKKSFR